MEDCCAPDAKQNNIKNNEMKGGDLKMERKLIMWIVIGILVLAVLYLTFKTGSTSGNAAVIQSAAASQSAAQSAASSGMVGGC